MIVTISRTIRPERLLDDVLAAIPALGGAPVQLVENAAAGTYTLVVPDGTNGATIDAVIAAHNPNTLGVVAQQAAVDTTALADFIAAYPTMLARLATIQSEMDTIRAHADTLAGLSTWSGLTLAQTTARLQAVMPSLGTDLGTVASEFKAVATGLTNMLEALAVLRRRQGGG